MIKIIEHGDLFDSKCDWLVNAVNCIGIMGGGIAKIFSNKYPEMMLSYKNECRNKVLQIGKPHYYMNTHDGKNIINFPTMFNPGSQANIDDIIKGLQTLNNDFNEIFTGSVAFCALGCGIGGLSWKPVYNAIKTYFDNDNRYIEFYMPL